MSSVVLSGDSSGSVTLTVPSAAGSNTVTIPASTGTAALTSDVIGVSQTWQVLTSSRASGVTYTNSTGKPIMVAIYGGSSTVSVGGVVVGTIGGVNSTVSVIVPNGATYISSANMVAWAELR